MDLVRFCHTKLFTDLLSDYNKSKNLIWNIYNLWFNLMITKQFLKIYETRPKRHYESSSFLLVKILGFLPFLLTAKYQQYTSLKFTDLLLPLNKQQQLLAHYKKISLRSSRAAFYNRRTVKRKILFAADLGRKITAVSFKFTFFFKAHLILSYHKQSI